MQKEQDIFNEVFGKIQNVLEELRQSESYEELLEKEELVTDLFQNFSFLKIYNNINDAPIVNNVTEVIDNQELIIEDQVVDLVENEEEIIESEVITNSYSTDEESEKVEEISSFNEIEKQEDVAEESNNVEISEIESENETFVENNEEPEVIDSLEEGLIAINESVEKLEPMQDSQFSFAMAKEDVVVNKPVVEEKIEETVSFQFENLTEKVEESQAVSNSVHEESQSLQEQAEKKIKLSHIKGLHQTKTLFDDELMEEANVNSANSSNNFSKESVVEVKQNPISTPQVQESAKVKPDFRLDLNDRIAFSQYLFGGSQTDLNETVKILNTFTDLEKAKEFLSDLYYEKHWEKADSYAQRLWTLVENRFL